MLLRTLRTIQNKIALFNKKVLLRKSDGSIVGHDDLQAAMAAASSGDVIDVQFPGTYDLGNNSLILKNGVNIFCVPGVTISSSNTNGTLIDNNVLCIMSIHGKPTITNTNGLKKRIVLQNGSSAVKRDRLISGNISTANMMGNITASVNIYENDNIIAPTASRTGTATYKLSFDANDINFSTNAIVNLYACNSSHSVKLVSGSNELTFYLLINGSQVDLAEMATAQVYFEITVYNYMD